MKNNTKGSTVLGVIAILILVVARNIDFNNIDFSRLSWIYVIISLAAIGAIAFLRSKK